MAVQFSPEQFEAFMARLPTAAAPVLNVAPTNHRRSITACPARYDGSRNRDKVEEFVTSATIFRTVEGISNEDALEGLPLLLTGTAHTWWKGVKLQIKSWDEAMKRLQEAFAPRKAAYKIYLEIFEEKQVANVSTDLFITRKRSLLSQIEQPLEEAVQLDMVFGLLRAEIREKISRSSITTFEELLIGARKVEEDLAEKTHATPAPPNGPKKLRCEFCRAVGHSMAECRKKKRSCPPQVAPANTTTPAANTSSTLRCYGCQRPGFMRRNCPTCNPSTSADRPVGFCSLNLVEPPTPRPRPAVAICAKGMWGTAFLDSGSRVSVASPGLSDHLRASGATFTKVPLTIVLADGHPQQQEVLTTKVNIVLQNKTVTTQFVCLPNAPDARTLLGIDFIEDAAMVIHFAARQWHFFEKPEESFQFVQKDMHRSPDCARVTTPTASRHDIRHPQIPGRREHTSALDAVVHAPTVQTPVDDSYAPMEVEEARAPALTPEEPIAYGPPPTVPIQRGHWKVYQAPGGAEYMMRDADDALSHAAFGEFDVWESLCLFNKSPRRVDIASINVLRADEATHFTEPARRRLEGYSAAYLVDGHEPRTVDDVTNDFRAIVQAENFIPEITPRLLQLDEVIKQVRENHEAAQDRRKNYADSKRRPGPVYQPGDLVLVDRHILSKKAQGLTSKLAPRRDGPYRILTKVGPTSYEIADPENPAEALGKYHTSALRPFVGSADAPDPPVAPIRRRGRPRKKPNVQDS
ncbi:hypothetical protein Zmor_006603 [Zophobas morio]|uniref:CCHC-type domain-containing protein n=1 Tax=Zophobas morio TaxID=2755281 RepID=A0AA38IXU7_9CUCU|nr:hypothetical protein Zmor_005717 [Zophobas morio]KAJ3662247.1 hypothetical protein Zmor_006603 [Zophobas morio]